MPTTCTHWTDLHRRDGGQCALLSRTVSFGTCARCDKLPEGTTPPTAPPLRGLGDLVALAAQPIARAIDRVAGTDIKNCGKCKKRQENWNKAVPFSKSD